MKIDPTIRNYIKRKKWEYRDDPTQYNLERCPYCGREDWKFYINKQTGQFTCFHSNSCGQEGSMWKLKSDQGDVSAVVPLTPVEKRLTPKERRILENRIERYHEKLLEEPKILRVLRNKWGFTKEIVNEFKLGLQRAGGKRWLVIPYYKQNKIVNAKFRTLPPSDKTFKRVKGLDSSLFNLDSINSNKEHVYLCEGETDAISLHSLGVENVLGVTVGARGFKPEWIDYLNQFETIYTVYDNDTAGQEGVAKVANRLGTHKCKNVKIPTKYGKDVNDFYKKGGSLKEFAILVKKSKLFEVEDIINVGSVLDDLEAELSFTKSLEDAGLITPWDKLNKLLGGFMPGDLIVVSGVAKVGKTTFVMNILLNYAMQGIPVLNYCLEMRPSRLMTKVIQFLRLIEKNSINRSDVIFVKSKYGRIPFYMGHSYQFTTEQVLDTIRESTKRYGFEIIAFDHLHFLVRGISNVSSEVSATVREFKLLAEELKIPIILICQPRKLQTSNKRMTTNDLRDSASIGQDADTVIIVHRNRVEETKERRAGESKIFSDDAEIIVDATRYNPGGYCELWYDGAISRFFTNKQEKGTLRRWTESGYTSK